jgi:signal transduction histidine kinase
MELPNNSGLKTERANQSNFVKIVNADPDGKVIVNREGIILFANPAAKNLFGYSGKKLIGMPIGFPLTSDKPAEVTIHHKDKEPIMAEMRAVEIEWEDKKANLVSLRDITERKKAEEEIKKFNKMTNDLQESIALQKHLEKIKTEFLSVTSHELRTPITPISSQVEMLLGEFFGKLTDEQKHSLEMIQRNVSQLDNLISDIFDISKMESGNINFAMNEWDINMVLKDVVESMGVKANARNIFLKLKAENIPHIIFDKDRIIQVLNNLINNAIKFTDSGGEIIVEAVDKKDHVLIKVIDTGIGISKEDCEKLFQPFVQADSSMSRNYEGTGLGLAISKGIIAAHQGSIWVESGPGKGSVFQFTIPYGLKTMKSEVELFSFNKEEQLNRFKAALKKEGYALKKDKSDEIFKDRIMDSKGRLRYDMSLKDLEEKGFIEKEDKKE